MRSIILIKNNQNLKKERNASNIITILLNILPLLPTTTIIVF